MTVETADMEFVENDTVSDDDVPEEAHNKLLNAVSQLYKKQRIDAPKRREPAQEISEFSLSSNTANRKNRVHINELLKDLEEKATHKEINVKVKAAQKKSKTLPKPLEKNEAEKISREIGYQNVCQKLDKWNSVVERYKLAEQLVFPLQQKKVELEAPKIQALREPSELEKAMAAVLNQSEVAQEEKKMEESLSQLTIEEMIERRKMMARMRARESYRIAKAVRQNKIKSKKYHRILKKERIKQELKDFEKLQKTDPEAALAKLEQIERARAEERISLRHRNTGKWAKSRAIRAKYDTEARMQLAEQLAKSRELTRKAKVDSSDSEEGMEDEVHEGDEPATVATPANSESNNPWIKESVVDQFLSGYQKFWSEKNKTGQETKQTLNLEKNSFIEANKNDGNSKNENDEECPKSHNPELQPDSNLDDNSKARNVLSNSVSTDATTNADLLSKSDEVNKNSHHQEILLATDSQNNSENKHLAIKRKRNPTNPSSVNTETDKEQWISSGANTLDSANTEKTTNLSISSHSHVIVTPESESSSSKRKLSSEDSQNGTPLKTRRSPLNKSVRLGKPKKGPGSVGSPEISMKNNDEVLSKYTNSTKKPRGVVGSPGQSRKSKASLNSKLKNQSDHKSYQDENSVNLVDLSSDLSSSEMSETEEDNDTILSTSGSWCVISEASPAKKRSQQKKSKKKTKDKTLNEMFDEAEEVIQNHTLAIAEKLRKENELVDEPEIESNVKEREHSFIKPLRKTRKNLEIDEALMEIHDEGISSGVNDLKSIRDKLNCQEREETTEKKEPQIDPNKHINVKPQKQFSELVGDLEETGNDSDEDNTQKNDLMEAFADDDIADEFRKEKEEESKRNKPENINFELPGWGSWGGTSIPTKSRRKRRRFTLKLPKIPRKDENKEHVIINEDPIPKLRQHLVNELPYPFTSVKDFEATIRAPIGKNWIPERAHKKLIAPPVVTKMGTIIEPMSDNIDLTSKKRRDRKSVV